MATFGELLRTLLARRNLSERSFAAVAKSSKSSISGIIMGSRTPPLAHTDAWCDVLGLRGQERQYFLDLAALAHLPQPARDRFQQLLADYRTIKAENGELMSQVRRAAEN
jgi:transcriptional regulator with XRE-family HTH domain